MQNNLNGLITQPNFIPWKGYFDSIAKTEIFIIYDDVQYTKRDWRNRNKIKVPGGSKWVSIPVKVKGKYSQLIKDVEIADKNWGKSIWGKVKHFYADSAFFNEMSEWLEPLFVDNRKKYLIQINVDFIVKINEFLGIDTKIEYSSDFNLPEDKNMRLVELCKHTGITNYWTGPAAKKYIDVEKFQEQGIKVSYFNYDDYKEYPQLYPPFYHNVSIIDLIFNTGRSANKYLKTPII